METKSKGWLRDIICQKEVDKRTYLSSNEKSVLTVVSGLFSGYRNDDEVVKDYCVAIRHAFGIGKTVHKEIFHNWVKSSYTQNRQVRSDIGQTVFNSLAKRKAVYTPYNSFKKRRNAEFREFTEKNSRSSIKR